MAIHKNQFKRILQGGECDLLSEGVYSFINNEENFHLFYDSNTHEVKEISDTNISERQINKIEEIILEFKKDQIEEDYRYDMSHEEQFNTFY